MKSIRRASVLSACVLASAVAIVLAGCGKDDGTRDIADGNTALAARDYKKAAEHFDAAAKACPTNVGTFLLVADTRLRLGEIDAAAAAVQSALLLSPADPDALSLDGRVAGLKKDYERAIKDYDAITQDGSLAAPVRAAAFCDRAAAERDRGAYDAARLALYRAIRLDRRNAAARYTLGALYRDACHFDAAALDQFEMFARLVPSTDERVEDVVRNVIPALRDSLARAAAARPGADKRDPGHAAKLIAAAEAAAAKRAYKPAIAGFAAALAADPLSYPAAYRAGQLLETTERTVPGLESAITAYKAAAEIQPASQAAYQGAARVALRLRRPATAVEVLSRAIAHEPENLVALDMFILACHETGVQENAALANAYQAYRQEISTAPARVVTAAPVAAAPAPAAASAAKPAATKAVKPAARSAKPGKAVKPAARSTKAVKSAKAPKSTKAVKPGASAKPGKSAKSAKSGSKVRK